MRRRYGVGLARAAGCVLAPRVADPRVHPRLVVGDPVLDAVAEPADDGFGVLDERLRRAARRPAARILERLRRVPVEERRERLDVVREQLVDEAVVEVEPGLVDRPAPRRHDARPGDREAKRVEPELAHQRDVVGIAVVEVARDRRRSRRCGPCPASRRTGPRRSRRVRPRGPRPRSGTTPSRRPRRSREGSEVVSMGMGVLSVRSDGAGAVTWQRAACCGLRLDELRSDARADVDRQRAARDEAAAVGRIDRGGRAALAAPRSASRAVSSRGRARRRAAGACTGAAAPSSTSSIGPLSTTWPAYITRMSSAT